ncbi:glycosyltransferase family 4 protein [Sphingomonas jaspsi]|uniref:glycosyltransferase family 4 protein n=1 Tax=Sphingomonas jaspsi TaxID=392409 RepID=UPI0004AEC266|nr:glycosyltransferase family 1 protein [Sphingomonas jaspsi]
MKPEELRIALFSGNYNYVRDGANQALNRLVEYLLRQGASVRVYSPVVEHPAFPPTGDLVNVPSVAIPGREEYRIPIALNGEALADLEAFAPNIVHVASPDVVAHRAVSWARRKQIPVVASVHTRFETYLQYYHLGLLEPALRALLRRFYRRCDAIVAPVDSTAAVLRAQRMHRDITIWSRGVDRDQFNPARRDMEWRRSHGIGDGEMVVAFLGRIVMEKGLDVFSDAIAAAERMQVPLRVLVIGDGPARPWFEEHLPKSAVFVGSQTGTDLGRALASADVFLNPSITEAFGNVTQEALSSGLPVIAAAATGATSLVQDGVSGTLVDPMEIDQYGAALKRYAEDPALRARHGAAGIEFARTRDWDNINSVMLKLYDRVIERRQRLQASFGPRWLPS